MVLRRRMETDLASKINRLLIKRNNAIDWLIIDYLLSHQNIVGFILF